MHGYFQQMFVLAATVMLQASEAQEMSVPFDLHPFGNAILISVSVNGKSARLLLDTGSQRTVLSPEMVGRKPQDLRATLLSSEGPGIQGEALWAEATLQIGEKTWKNRLVAIMNLEQVSRIYRCRIDGLLGQDVLREFDSVQINFKRRELIFYRLKRP